MPTTFDRSGPISKYDKLESGKSMWNTNRSIWQDNLDDVDASRRTFASIPQGPRPTDGFLATTTRHNSSSSTKFSKQPSSSALATIENPRNSLGEGTNIWGGASNGTLNKQSPNYTSPTKTKGSAWLYDSRSHDVENASSLLVGSAPEFEPFGNESSVITTRHSRLADEAAGFDTRFIHSLRSTGPSQVPAPHRSLNNVPTQSTRKTLAEISEYSMKPQLHGLGMNTSPTAARDPPRSNHNSVSPTTSSFAQQMSGYLERNSGSVNAATDALRGLNITRHSPVCETYPSNTATGLDRSAYSNKDDVTLNALIQAYDNGTYYGNVPWYDRDFQDQPTAVYSHEIRQDYNGDYRNGYSSSHYSASITPPSATESRFNSGVTSRSSHHEALMASRKANAHDLYQYYANNGMIVPTTAMPLDVAVRGYNVPMNPMAASYQYYPSARPYGVRENQRALPPVRSALLEDFRINKLIKRYELRDIFGHIVEFSGDQHGSRFIQQKLESANSDDKDQVFSEIQSDALQLMTDLFGNYVIQKLFEHGNQTQKKMLADHMKGHVAFLSTQAYGCRVVQKAIEHVLTEQQASIARELDTPSKHILKIIRDQNGNHVVQKMIERIAPEHIQFIIEAHRGEVIKLAQHTYGCRVIQRILEHCTKAAKRIILDELHSCITPLITDAFGNYVVQHVIENGELEDRRRVIDIVLHQLLMFSKHKFASNVVEMCLQYAEVDQRTQLVRQLIAPNETGQSPVYGLLRDQYGNYVIRTYPDFILEHRY